MVSALPQGGIEMDYENMISWSDVAPLLVFYATIFVWACGTFYWAVKS